MKDTLDPRPDGDMKNNVDSLCVKIIDKNRSTIIHDLWPKTVEETKTRNPRGLCWGCPGVPVHEGIPIVFITIHGLMTQFVNVSFFCVPVHEDTTVVLTAKVRNNTS